MKKLLALILAIAIIASMAITVSAENTTGGTTEVSFKVDPTYIVTIPATVELNLVNTDGVVTYENDYTITAEAGVRLKKGEYIQVTVDSDYIMETAEGATLAYTITKDKAALVNSIVAEYHTDKAAQTSVIHIAANDPEFAGEYKDTVTFTLEVKTN